MRLALAALLALQPVVQAAELAPVDILLTKAIPQDEAALALAGPEKGERLAILQSDLALVIEGLEGFANEADAAPSLKRLQESVDAPEQFKDRAAALDAAYRALAVVDYTWAKRLPDAPCSPDASRAALLKSGALSSWISSLLGVEGDAAAALDRASAATKASAREYALLRAKVRRLSEALGSEKAVGAMRASLYCRRAETYEALSAANRSSGLTAASRATGNDDVDGVYVLARPGADGWEILGAATSIDGAIVTDARLADSEGLALLGRDGKKPIPVTVERRDSGLALLRASEPVKGLVLAEAAPAKDDLIEALGHPERTGVWTRTRGLVTSADALSFQSDAVVDVGMAGGAALTEDGKLAGVFVLRRARAGGEAFDWPVGVSAPALRNWLVGGTLTAPSGSVEIAEAGTASILTASRPLGVGTPAGTQATQVSHHVFYQDGIRAVCMANCDDPVPAPAPRARSRTRYTNPRSSYGSSSNANAELGKALGEAIAPLVEAMIFKGIPALFRGIGSLFKSKPKSPTTQNETKVEPKVVESPKPEPKYTLQVQAAKPTARPDEVVTFIATITRNREDMPLGRIKVDFKINGQDVSGFTDNSGKLVLTVEPPRSERAHAALDKESAKHALLTNTSGAAEGTCKIVLQGAAGIVMATALVFSVAGGPAAVGLTGKACVTLAVGTAGVAGVTCAAAFGVDALLIPKAPPTALPYSPTQWDVPTTNVRTGPDSARLSKVESAADDSHDMLAAEARKMAANEAATGQPADPNEPPEDGEESEVKEQEVQVSQERLEHIVERHWTSSGASGAGKFAQGTRGRDLLRMIKETARLGKKSPNTHGRPGDIYEYTFKDTIGVNSKGAATKTLRVILGTDRSVITAFPF